MNNAKEAAKNLMETLQNKLPGIKIGVVNFNENANIIGNAETTDKQRLKNGINELTAGGETAIGRGIRSGIAGYSSNGKLRLMILITDGQETVETEEAVIMQIEALREGQIKLTTLLTGESINIFGTEEEPRYGSVYKIGENGSISPEVGNKIYEEIIRQSEIEADRSLGKDIEADRRTQIEKYNPMNYTKADELDVDKILELQSEAKGEITEEIRTRVEKLATNTKMRTETSKVRFTANNVGPDQIHEVNQALLERPKTKLVLNQDILGIKVTLSDGKVIIDTAKGVSKNVLGLDVKDNSMPVSIFMDEEIMQGATIEIKYKLTLENRGEVDSLRNYFENGSTDTIPTTAKVIYAYINQNIVYRAESQKAGDAEWQIVDLNKEAGKNLAKEELSPDTLKGVETSKTAETQKEVKMLLRTEDLSEKKLYPVNSKEVLNGNGEYASGISTELVLSRLISPEEDDSTSLSFECAMQVTVRGNEVGRRVYNSIPGDHKVEATYMVGGEEGEESIARRIVITKPWGEDRSITYVMVALGIAIVLAGGIIYIKRKKQ